MDDSTEDFAALFEASQKTARVENGQTVTGTIVAIGPEVAFVDVGGKGEATIDVAELKDAEGQLEVVVGDRLDAVVVSTAHGVSLSRKLARGAASLRQLEAAFHSGLPVEGKVERAIKGGYEVGINHQRAFCPASQIDTSRSDPAGHDGRVYTFRIIDFKEDGRNIVVSRRVLLEEDQRRAAEDVRRSIVVDAVIEGRVASVREFGAFIDLGAGVHGLLHASEMAWTRIRHASEVVEEGQPITVKVIQVDEGKQRISLSLKQLLDDPWSRLPATIAVGQVLSGRVTRVVEFGAFVALDAGIEGLVHASTFAPTGRARAWTATVAPGTVAAFEILSLDVEKKRVGLALVPEATSRADAVVAAPVSSIEAAGEASASERLGSLADKLRGALQSRIR